MTPIRPIIIAGPCGVESREQLLDTCAALAATGKVDMIRAGVWKPRTRPGQFEGVGEQGLAWLAEAREATGLPFGVEVANTRHVEAALAAGADMVWVGARTAVNPFSVQEIAEALRGAQVTVLLKNPILPDLNLWSGAVERLLRMDIPPERLGLVHRGFSQAGNPEFRNPPMWHLSLEMKRRYPALAMLCDPSHIKGRREGLYEVAQKAADLSYDGLMVESHIDPACALSDAAQQLTPAALAAMLDRIKWRGEAGSEAGFADEIERCRAEIDNMDSEIFSLLSSRMKVAERIGTIKKGGGVRILQPRRWDEITERTVARCRELDLSPEFIRTILDAIHIESIDHQDKVMNK